MSLQDILTYAVPLVLGGAALEAGRRRDLRNIKKRRLQGEKDQLSEQRRTMVILTEYQPEPHRDQNN